jgi:hypothetical protein
MKNFNSGRPLISQEEFDMLIMQAPTERVRATDNNPVSNWFLVCSAIIYIVLLIAAQQNPGTAYNLTTIEMSSVYMTSYRIIYTLVLAGIYYIGQNTKWHSEKIAYISFAMVLNALLMELAFTKLPGSITEFGFFTIIVLMKTMIVGIFYTNIKNKTD